MTYHSPWTRTDVEEFRATARRFLEKEFTPHQARWRQQRYPDAEAWNAAGRAGILLPDVSQDYGGGGGTFAHHAVVIEELARAGVQFGAIAHNVVAHYLLAYGSEEQKCRWLPRMAHGELVGAVAFTEPGAGSDLQNIKTAALKNGDYYSLTGSKTFITNGWHAGLLCAAAKTNNQVAGLKSLSIILVETDGLQGYKAGRPIDTVGMHAQDTCELYFDDVRVPTANLLGGVEGNGFVQMMEQLPYERLSVGVSAVATAEEAVRITAQYTAERMVSDAPLIHFQNTRFKLAECRTDAFVSRIFVDNCIERYLSGEIDDVSVAMAKYWLTERENRIIDECVQMHGGYGYVVGHPIARMWTDSRVHRIYAGTNEVMKELIGWAR